MAEGQTPGAVARFARLVGSGTALLLTLSLVGALIYVYGHFEELQEQLSGVEARADQSVQLSRAADSAIGYVEDLATAPPSTGVGRGYRYSHPAPTGVEADPGHWCSDTVIGYRIDFTGARAAGSTPEKERNRWKQAFADWTGASGGRYTFEYRGPAHYPVADGTTAGYPIDPDTVPSGEIAITYAVPPAEQSGRWDGYRHPSLTDALGVAGTGPLDWSTGPDQGIVSRGMIVLDALDSELDPRAVPVPYVHEAGHALGLSHVSDPGQMMYDTAGATSRINDGDRAGISRLASLPCG